MGPTDRPRLIAIFSYDERPGMVFSEATERMPRTASDVALPGYRPTLSIDLQTGWISYPR